jgi:DNA repair photolyase
VKQPLLLVQPVAVAGRPLPRVELIDRHGAVLRPNPMSDVVEGEVCGLNLMAGCPQQCTFCFVRAYPGYPGDEVVYLYRNTVERLRQELRERQSLPRAVYLCPSTDPFAPVLAVQEMACQVLEVLAEYGVEAWFMTRGYIRPFAMAALARHRELVRVTVGLTTTDNRLRRVLEPLAAPPHLRLKQLAQLRRLGVATQVAVEPLIPGLTDTRENIVPLLDVLAAEGVERVTTSYMYLRQGIREHLAAEQGELGWAEPIIDAYAYGPTLAMGSIAPAKHLPQAQRQRGYALLMALAASRGITVSVSGLTNPDFKPPRPASPRPETSLRQMVLKYEP